MSNLVGCILTRQLPFQTYLAAYFCCVDFCLLAQYLYYYKLPSEESSPISASTPLLEEGLAHSVTERYGSTGSTSRRYSAVSASYPPPGLLPSSDNVPTHALSLSISRSRSRVRALSLRGSTLSKRATLRELQTTAANIAQAADSLLLQQQGHQRPRSASYVGHSRPSALSPTSVDIDAAMRIPRFEEPKSDAEDEEVNLLAESYHSEAGGSHPRHRSITWTNTPLPSSSQSQPIERREVVHGGDESEDTALSGETPRQRSRSRGRPTTRHLFETTPLDAVPGSYVESPNEASAPQVEGAFVQLERHRMSTSGNRARGKRSAGIVFLSVGVGALFAFGTRLEASKEVGETKGGAVEMGEGRVLGIGRGYPLEDQETGILSNDYTGAHTPLVHILYADINDELPLPPHNRHERPERTTEDKRRIIGRISAWTCTTLYLTSRLPQIWKNVSAFSWHFSLGPY